MIHWRTLLFFFLTVPDFGQCFELGFEDLSHQRFEGIAKYVGTLIKDYNEKNSELTNDVSLIQFLKFPDDHSVERILMKLPKKNVVLMPQLKKKIKSQHIRTAAFVIIVADNFDTVSF